MQCYVNHIQEKMTTRFGDEVTRFMFVSFANYYIMYDRYQSTGFIAAHSIVKSKHFLIF